MSTLATFDIQWSSKHFDVLKGIDLVGRALEDTRKTAVTMANAMDNVARVTGAVKTAMNVAGDAVQKFGNSVSNASRGVMQFGQSITSSITNPLVNAGKAAVGISSQMEVARGAFTRMLGTAQKADDYIKELAAFAEKTPFEFSGLQENAKRMMAFGFESQKVIPILRTVGDSLSYFGSFGSEQISRAVLALGQMRSSGTALKQDLNQLINLNIPVFDILREKLGLTAKQVARIGEQGIESSKVIEALLSGMAERFGGAMGEMAQSLTGLISSVTDVIFISMGELGKAITQTFDLKSVAQGLISSIKEATAWFKALDDTTKGVIITFAAVVAAIGPALTIIGQIGLGVGALVAAFGFLMTPMGIITASFGLLIEETIRLGLTQDDLRARLVAAWPAIRFAVEGAVSAMKTIFSAGMAAMRGDWEQFHQLMDAGSAKLGSALQIAWTAASAALEPILSRALENTTALLDKAFDKMIEKAKGLASQLPGIILSGLGSIPQFLMESALTDEQWVEYAKHLPKTSKAAGGWISGPGTSTSDSIHARLSTGEFVVNAASARQFGPALEAINSARGFARGGWASGGQDPRLAAIAASGVDPTQEILAAIAAELAADQAARLPMLLAGAKSALGAAGGALGGIGSGVSSALSGEGGAFRGVGAAAETDEIIAASADWLEQIDAMTQAAEDAATKAREMADAAGDLDAGLDDMQAAVTKSAKAAETTIPGYLGVSDSLAGARFSVESSMEDLSKAIVDMSKAMYIADDSVTKMFDGMASTGPLWDQLHAGLMGAVQGFSGTGIGTFKIIQQQQEDALNTLRFVEATGGLLDDALRGPIAGAGALEASIFDLVGSTRAASAAQLAAAGATLQAAAVVAAQAQAMGGPRASLSQLELAQQQAAMGGLQGALNAASGGLTSGITVPGLSQWNVNAAGQANAGSYGSNAWNLAAGAMAGQGPGYYGSSQWNGAAGARQQTPGNTYFVTPQNDVLFRYMQAGKQQSMGSNIPDWPT